MTPIHDRDNIQLYHGDCLKVLPTLPSESVALVVADLPYGTTAAVWDKKRIDEKVLWAELRRVLTPTGTAIFTATYPLWFDLIAAARDLFKYKRIWVKSRPFGFVHAENMPLSLHEEVLIFSKGTIAHTDKGLSRMTFNPQMVKGEPYKLKKYKEKTKGKLYSGRPSDRDMLVENEGTRNPTTLMFYANPNHDKDHPSEKPIDLITDLILTYSNPDDLILDPTCGSGTTLRAALNTGRRAIGIEQDAGYCQVTIDRMAQGVLLTV